MYSKLLCTVILHEDSCYQPKRLGDRGAKYCIIVIIKCEITWY